MLRLVGTGTEPDALPPAAAEAVRKAERDKDHFLSAVSHELKTPLTPLKSVAQLMRLRMRKARSGEKPLDMDALDRSLATIERQVERMDRLVTDLLEVSRVGRGRFELRKAPFDLAALVRDVVAKWIEGTAEEGRHTIDAEIPDSLEVTGDRQRIEQILMGLLANAVKFSPHGGRVGVRLETADGAACVVVRDEGIGIPADELATVGREPFVRGARASGYNGVGVGMYLGRLIAEGHGGRLEVESAGSDQGTTARLTLPRSG